MTPGVENFWLRRLWGEDGTANRVLNYMLLFFYLLAAFCCCCNLNCSLSCVQQTHAGLKGRTLSLNLKVAAAAAVTVWWWGGDVDGSGGKLYLVRDDHRRASADAHDGQRRLGGEEVQDLSHFCHLSTEQKSSLEAMSHKKSLHCGK